MERKNKYLILIFVFIAITMIAGTFAWLTYRSSKTAMVLTVGNLNNVQITLSPYQIDGELDPVTTYTSGISTNVTAINNNSNSALALGRLRICSGVSEGGTVSLVNMCFL